MGSSHSAIVPGLVVGVSALWLLCLSAAAQPLGPEGSPLDTSQFALDAFRGPVQGTSRMVGLAGAVVSIAEGTEGGLRNPAAVANRPQQSVEWWDYWYGLGFVYPLDTDDYYNTGQVTALTDEADFDLDTFYFNPGGYLQFNQFGFGANLDIETIRVTSPEGRSLGQLSYNIMTSHIQFGYGFLDGQLVVGAGPMIVSNFFRLSGSSFQDQSYSRSGVGAEAGIIYRPEGKQWRVAAAAFTRAKVDISDSRAELEGDEIGRRDAGTAVFLSTRIVKPWSGSLGFSYQFGKRPFNPKVTWARQEVAEEIAVIDRTRNIARRRYMFRRARAADDGASKKVLEKLKSAYEREDDVLSKRRKKLIRDEFYRLRRNMRFNWPRHYLLVSSELRFVGSVNDGLSAPGFVRQVVQRSGEKVAVIPHLGVEGEPWARRLKLRAGVYVEPSRVQNTDARVHGTVGFDIRVLKWNVFGIWPDDHEWAVSAAYDGTVGYQALSLGVTSWF